MRKFLFILALFFIAQKASGQSFVGTVSGTLTIDSMYILSTSAGSQLTFAGVNDYASPKVVASYSTVTVKCNYNWRLMVRAQNANFTGGAGTSTMPCSVLRIRKSGGTYMTVSTTDQSLATGNRGSDAVSGNTFTVDLEANPGFNYNGGLYNINLVYTITRQ